MTVPSLATIPTHGREGFAKQGAAVVVTPFGTDAFTDTATTLLPAHTPTTGLAWSKHATATQDAQISSANRARISALNAGLGAVYRKTDTPPSADYAPEADMIPMSLPGSSISFSARLFARMDASAATWYEFNFQWSTAGAGTWALNKRITGTATPLTTAVAASVVAGQAYRMKLTAIGTAITGYVDGVQVITGTDASVTAAGFAGIGFTGSSSTSLDTANCAHLDNFSVQAA